MNGFVDRIKPDSYGITTYLETLRRGEYQIPTFQRDVVWDRDKVKQLWDSIYKFYPLGSVLVWRTETQLQKHRTVGGHPIRDEGSRHEYQYLLDGQQRTTALLTSIYGGEIAGMPDHDPSLYVDLTIKDSGEVEDAAWRERFLFWDEIDDRDGTLLRNAGRKKRFDSGLIVRLRDVVEDYSSVEKRLNDLGHTDYDDPARVQLRRLKQVLDNYKISFIELRGIEVAEVCQIFERVNQAGQPLSMFDIVVAKTFRPEEPGQKGFYLRELFHGFRHELETAGSAYHAVDDMTLLQIMAVLVREARPDAGVQNITDRYLNVLKAEHLEELWDDASRAMRKVFDFFENHLYLPGPALIPFRYFYMSIAAYMFRNSAPDYDFLRRYFWYHSFHDEDLLTNTTHLADHVRRLQCARSGNEFGFDRFVLNRERLRTTSYSSRGRLSRAILALYANQRPCDWSYPDRSVLVSVYYMLTDQPNLHHIFPTEYCERRPGEEGRHYNSLMNIAYLTQLTNLQISNKNPLIYLNDYIHNFDEIEQAHLLPDLLREWCHAGKMPSDPLNTFIEARLDIVIQRLQELLDGIQFTVVDTGKEVGESGSMVAELAATSDVDTAS